MKSFVGKPVGGNIFLNPGTGPVDDATEANARANVQSFVAELGLDDVRVRRHPRADYGEGRYAFRLYYGKRMVEVQMPGLALDQVRFLGREYDQDPWDYPRMYVDGSSWLWRFGLHAARDRLAKTGEAYD